jgi:hypothetical protein
MRGSTSLSSSSHFPPSRILGSARSENPGARLSVEPDQNLTVYGQIDLFPTERIVFGSGCLHMDLRNPLGAILQDGRRREGFDAGLKRVFPTCQDPLSARLEELLQQLSDRDLEAASPDGS